MGRTIDEQLHRTGYDLEEQYFYELNRRLLDDLRAKRTAAKSQEAWWMHCPHCGCGLKEQTVLGLKGDVCEGCGGVFLDPDELGHLTASHEGGALKDVLKRFFAEVIKPRATGIGQFPV